MTRPLRFALFGNVYHKSRANSIKEILALLEKRKAELLIDRPLHESLASDLGINVHSAELLDGNDFTADYAISMGGDGTFLEAARRVGEKEIPILGINMGRLGFLADFLTEDMPRAIEQMYEGTLQSERRSVLQVHYSKGNPADYPYALNEVAVLKRDNSSMISIRVAVNGEYLTTYQADGLIINTPSGSTGYALSVGGPIMAPGSETLGLVPVAPHSLNIRPISLPDTVEITLDVESRSHNFLVAIDGRSESCQEGIQLTIKRAPYDVHVVKQAQGSFFQTLRDKLMWGSDVRVAE